MKKRLVIYLVFAVIYLTLGIVAAFGYYDNPIFLAATILLWVADCYIERKLER